MDFNIEAIERQMANDVRVGAEGKATFSLRSVSTMTGTSHTALSQSLATSGNKTPSKLSQVLIQHGFECKKITEFGKTGVPDTAVSIIVGYYAMLAGDRCTETAKRFMMAFTAIGIRAYAHKLTGYDKVEQDYHVTLAQLLNGQVPLAPTEYYPKYHKAFWDALERCYGLKRGQWACGRFINCYIYGYLPEEVQKRLKEVNPLQDDGTRNNKYHQHLDGFMLQLMINRLVVITALLAASVDRKAFKKLVRRIPKIKFNPTNIKALAGVG